MNKRQSSVGELFLKWSPIIITLLAFLAGSGWLKYFMERQQAEYARYQSIYENFLIPFENIITQTEVIFADLQGRDGTKNLDSNENIFRHYITQLDNNNLATQALWRARINSLILENRNAIELLNNFDGSIQTPEFRVAANEFRSHVIKRDDHWEAIQEVGATSFSEISLPPTPRIPDNFHSALAAEMVVVLKKAGM